MAPAEDEAKAISTRPCWITTVSPCSRRKPSLENVRDQVRAANKNAKSDEVDMVPMLENAITSASKAAEDGIYALPAGADYHDRRHVPRDGRAGGTPRGEPARPNGQRSLDKAADSARREAMRRDPKHYVVQGATSVADMIKKRRCSKRNLGKPNVQAPNKVHSPLMFSTADLTAISISRNAGEHPGPGRVKETRNLLWTPRPSTPPCLRSRK